MDIETEILAIMCAVYASCPGYSPPTPDDLERLHAAGYRRWRNPAGQTKVLRAEPVLGEGPWTPSPVQE